MVDRAVAIRLQAEMAAYEQAMGRAARATENVGKAGEKSSGILNRAVSGSVKALAGATTVAATATGVLGAAIIKTGAGYNTLEQQARASMKTVLGSSQAANQMMEKLGEFTATSPFPRQAFIEGTQQLLAFGMEAEKVIPTLGAVQDAVAAAGGTSTQLSEVIFVLAQIQAAGKITGQDLMQLGQRGINAADLIGDSLGMTGQQVRESITAGTLDAEVALQALTDGMSASFGGAAENVKNTWIGAVDRIKAAFRDISSIIMEPFITKSGGGTALDWANGFADALRAIERQVEPLVGVLSTRFGGAMDGATGKLQDAAEAIDGWDTSKLLAHIDDLVAYAPLIGGVGAALVTMGTNSLPILSSLGLSGINPVVAGLGTLVALHPDLRGLLGDFLSDLQPLLPVLGSTAAGLLDAGTAIIDSLLPGLAAILETAAPVAVALGTGLGGAAVGLAQGLVPVADALSTVLGLVAAIPEPVLIAAGVFGILKSINISPLTGGLRNLNQQMAVQSSLAAMGGQQVGFFGAATGVAGKAVTGLGRAIKTAFITNPVGIAIAGLATVLSIFATRTAEAEARADELRRTLDEQTGAVTENTEAFMANLLQDEKSGLISYYRELGGNVQDLTGYLLGEADARGRVRDRIQDEIDKNRDLAIQYQSQPATAARFDGYADAAEEHLRWLDRESGAIEEQSAKILENNELTGDSAAATEELTGKMQEGVDKVGNFALKIGEASAAQEELAAINKEAQEAFDEWLGMVSESATAFVDHKAALDNVQGATKEWAEQQAQAHRDWASETGNAVDEAKGSWENYYDGMSINLEKYLEELESMAAAQANWQDNISSLVGKVPDDYLDMLIDMGVDGAPLVQAIVDDQTGATDKIVEVWGTSGSDSMDAWGEGLSTQRAVVGLVAESEGEELGSSMIMGLSRKLKDGEVTAKDVIDEYDLRAELELLAETDPAYRAVLEEIERIEELEATAKINADSGLAVGVAQEWFDKTAAMIPTPVIDADAWKAEREAQWWYDDTADMVPTPVIDADAWKADRERDNWYERTRKTEPTMNINADDTKAQAELDGWFYRNNNRSISVAVKASVSSSNVGFNIGVGKNEDGGLYHRADGGFDSRGRRVAREPMMYGPQYGISDVLWPSMDGKGMTLSGENNIPWEAYISGKPGREKRNIDILEQAAAKFGLTLSSHANGALKTNINLTGGGITGRTIDSLINDWADHNLTATPKVQTGNWRALWRMVQPWGVGLTSAYRPGAVTATGFPSKHGQGKAIDVTPHYGLWRWLEAQKSSFAELYGPWGLWLRGMNRYAFPGAAITARNHRDHIHIASYENGGLLENGLKAADTGKVVLDKGWNAVYNGLGRLEHLEERRYDTNTAAASYGEVQVRLDPGAERTLVAAAVSAAAAADRPVSLRVDSREVAYANRRGESSFGAPGTWSGAPRIGRN